jgi:broad specificity phosphatase PhoE
MPLTLLFIRHAQSLGNGEGRMMGALLDDALSEVGIWQAQQLGQQLQSQPPTHVYCSPQQRARQTLAIVKEKMGQSLAEIPVQERAELREYHNGIVQGLTWAEAIDRHRELCHRLESSLTWIPIPEAEPLQQGRDRAQRFMQALLHTHRDGDRVWIISHSWILQQMIAVLLGGDRTWGLPVDYTGLFEFQLWRCHWDCQDENRWNTELWKLVRFNDVRHLSVPEVTTNTDT